MVGKDNTTIGNHGWGEPFLGIGYHYWRIVSPLKEAKADSGRGGAKKCIQDPTTADHCYHCRRFGCRQNFSLSKIAI